MGGEFDYQLKQLMEDVAMYDLQPTDADEAIGVEEQQVEDEYRRGCVVVMDEIEDTLRAEDEDIEEGQ